MNKEENDVHYVNPYGKMINVYVGGNNKEQKVKVENNKIQNLYYKCVILDDDICNIIGNINKNFKVNDKTNRKMKNNRETKMKMKFIIYTKFVNIVE